MSRSGPDYASADVHFRVSLFINNSSQKGAVYLMSGSIIPHDPHMYGLVPILEMVQKGAQKGVQKGPLRGPKTPSWPKCAYVLKCPFLANLPPFLSFRSQNQ